MKNEIHQEDQGKDKRKNFILGLIMISQWLFSKLRTLPEGLEPNLAKIKFNIMPTN